jgi:hypothetical protein
MAWRWFTGTETCCQLYTNNYIYIYTHTHTHIYIYICVCVCVLCVWLNKLLYHIFPSIFITFLVRRYNLTVFPFFRDFSHRQHFIKTAIISHKTSFLHFYIVQNSSYFHQMILVHVTKIVGNSSNPVLVKATRYDQNRVINFVPWYEQAFRK